jgi:hypothetical protein
MRRQLPTQAPLPDPTRHDHGIHHIPRHRRNQHSQQHLIRPHHHTITHDQQPCQPPQPLSPRHAEPTEKQQTNTMINLSYVALGLNQATLAPMQTVWARGQTITQRLPGTVKDRSRFVKDAVIEQNLADQLRRAHHNHFVRTDPDTYQVTVDGQGGHKTQRIIQQ